MLLFQMMVLLSLDEGFTFHSDTDVAWCGENVWAEIKVVIAMVNLLVDILCRRKHEDSFALNRRLGIHSRVLSVNTSRQTHGGDFVIRINSTHNGKAMASVNYSVFPSSFETNARLNWIFCEGKETIESLKKSFKMDLFPINNYTPISDLCHWICIIAFNF